MFSALNKNGKAAIICSQGILFRGGEEEDIRKKMIEDDIIEGIIALPPKLFYGTGIVIYCFSTFRGAKGIVFSWIILVNCYLVNIL